MTLSFWTQVMKVKKTLKNKHASIRNELDDLRMMLSLR